ncbi:hypothetical protein [Aurantimonas sp. VKM B-3413]|uniref:hypothetical protein n=1 Tax=Aurantimonas sp. VKM B-3413 TaxID=2779401 RepID=UPI001E54E5BB|nr:hypothetical protein [Aurantimonas sp. VKM B-3413]MCB8837823.1 hypothetical protein [Aurantimonas sp. VKM B-3413]
MKHLYLAASVATALTLSGCGDDNQARVTELEGQLQTVQTENESLQGQVRDLQSEQAIAANRVDPATLREPLTSAFTALGETERQLDKLAGALAQEGYENVSLDPLRTNIREVSESVASAARDVGVDVDAVLSQAQSAVEEQTGSVTPPDIAQPGDAAASSQTGGSAEQPASAEPAEDAASTQPAQ